MYIRVHYATETIIETACQKKKTPWNAKCPIFLGNFTPKTSNYCLKNRALGFPGRCESVRGSCTFLENIRTGGCPCFPNFQSVFFVKRCVFFGKCWCCYSKNGIALQQNRKFHIFITYIYYIHLQMLHDPLLFEFTGV